LWAQDEESISIQRCATITGSAVYCQVGWIIGYNIICPFFFLLLRPSVLVNFPQLDIIQALCVYFTAGLSGGFDNGSQATGRDRHFSQVEPDLGDEPSPSIEQLDYLAPSVPRV
jgi:hypothetical protein